MVAGNIERQWYLVHAKPRQESVAELHLQCMKVETFCPWLKLLTRIQSKAAGREPLFPGYLFVKIHVPTEYRKVTYSHGVSGIVRFGATPAIVDTNIIKSIRSRIHTNFDGKLDVKLSHGQKVRIEKGVLRGFEAVFDQKLNGAQRVALLLKTVAYQGRIVIDPSSLTVQL